MPARSKQSATPRPTPSRHTAPKYAFNSANRCLAGPNPYRFNSATNATRIWPGTEKRADAFLRNSLKKLAWRLQATSEFDDVYHDLVVRMLPKLTKVQPTRGDPDKFVSLAAFRCLASILRDHRAAKRFVKSLESLNGWVIGPGGRWQRLDQTLGDQADRRVRRSRRSHIDQADLRIDLAEVMQALPPALRTVAERLGQQSVTQIADELGLARTTIHARIRSIRQRFEHADLRKYL
jgi:RNA polymerase sigma factor (sigma-70 family)